MARLMWENEAALKVNHQNCLHNKETCPKMPRRREKRRKSLAESQPPHRQRREAIMGTKSRLRINESIPMTSTSALTKEIYSIVAITGEQILCYLMALVRKIVRKNNLWLCLDLVSHLKNPNTTSKFQMNRCWAASYKTTSNKRKAKSLCESGLL